MIRDLVEQIPEADFDIESEGSQGQVEIIGWLYQYYNQEPKDKAFKKRNYTQADIPAVTQLFTPDWIVKYLVENSVGRLWINHLQAAGDTRTAQDLAHEFGWHYFMPDAEQSDAVAVLAQRNNQSLSDLKPENIRIIDPSMGSGHILIYAFDLLVQLYTSVGYSQREASRMILSHNLFGADIDTRAFQLTYFAMMMKGRQYDRRLLRAEVTPQVFDVPDIHWNQNDLAQLTKEPKVLDALKTLASLFGHGDELGSLISAHFDPDVLSSLHAIVAAKDNVGQLSLQSIQLNQIRQELAQVLAVLELLTREYQVSVTNPPYMGSGKMPSFLASFVKKHYPNSKSDLFGVFMERLRELTVDQGYYAMITQHQWMFLSSFEALRKTLNQQTIINLAHLGTRAFEEIGGEVVQSVAFVMQKQNTEGFIGTYERLVDFDSQNKKEQAYLRAVENPKLKYIYCANQAKFQQISESPIAYWFTEKLFRLFDTLPSLDSIVDLKAGLSTGDNILFQRRWSEVNLTQISFDTEEVNDTKHLDKRWYPCRTGGDFIRWYSKNEVVVDWQHNGERIRTHRNGKGNIAGAARNTEYYFKPGISWTKLSSSKFGVKFAPPGYIFDDTSRTMFPKNSDVTELVMGILNSKVTFHLLQGLNPSMSFTNGDLRRIPTPSTPTPTINNLVDQSITSVRGFIIASEDSWSFRSSPLLDHIADHKLAAFLNEWRSPPLCANFVPRYPHTTQRSVSRPWSVIEKEEMSGSTKSHTKIQTASTGNYANQAFSLKAKQKSRLVRSNLTTSARVIIRQETFRSLIILVGGWPYTRPTQSPPSRSSSTRIRCNTFGDCLVERH